MATYEIWTEEADRAGRSIPIRLYDPRPRFRKGGMARTAEMVRQEGDMGDDVLLHVNPQEFSQLVEAWGDPTFNDTTGLPEWGLKRLLKKTGKFVKRALKNPIVSTALMVGANMLLPGVGGLIAQSLIGAAGSKAKGGNPWLGALTGAAGHFIGGGNMAVGGGGPSTLSSLASKIPTTAGGAGAGAGSAGVEDLAHLAGASAGSGAAGATKGALSGFAGKIGDAAKPMVEGALSTAASPIGRISTQLALEGMRGSEASYAQALKQSQQGEQPTSGDFGSGFGNPMPALSFGRKRRQVDPEDYYTYGQDSGEQTFFDPNMIPEFNPEPVPVPALASGGGVRGPGTGRSDDIEALLSDGEYVVDAESVALLGDGSNEAGAKKLDRMRAELRKHKGSALAKGKFSPEAEEPEHYMGHARGGAIRSIISGGAKSLTHEERLARLRAIQRIEAAERAKKRGTEEIDLPSELEDPPPIKKAKGGTVKVSAKTRDAVRQLNEMADRLREELDTGTPDRVKEISSQIDALSPGGSQQLIPAMARGGSVAKIMQKLFAALERKPVEETLPPIHNQGRDTADIQAELARLNPDSNALRQIRFEDLRRRIKDRRVIGEDLAEVE